MTTVSNNMTTVSNNTNTRTNGNSTTTMAELLIPKPKRNRSPKPARKRLSKAIHVRLTTDDYINMTILSYMLNKPTSTILRVGVSNIINSLPRNTQRDLMLVRALSEGDLEVAEKFISQASELDIPLEEMAKRLEEVE